MKNIPKSYNFKLLLKKAIAMVAFSIFMFSTIGANVKTQDLVDCENPSEWAGMVKLNDQIKRSGKNSFELYGKYQTEIACRQMIPIDFDKTYKLSVWMRTLDKQFPASGYFGLRMYNKDKKPINLNNVAVFPNTETTLIADAAKDTKELSILKNEKWLKPKDSVVAFNIEDKYQDLPNFDLLRVDKIVDEGRLYKVILRNSLKKTYPAGTKIRLHYPWGVPFYWVASGWMPIEWMQFSTTIKGEAQSGATMDKFWRGTRYVRVVVWFGNYKRIPKEGARLLVDDIKFSCK